MNKTEDDEMGDEELSDEEIRALSEGLCLYCIFSRRLNSIPVLGWGWRSHVGYSCWTLSHFSCDGCYPTCPCTIHMYLEQTGVLPPPFP